MTRMGDPIAGVAVPGRVEVDEEGDTFLSFDYIIANTGGSPSGPLYMKLYTGPEVELNGGASTDEPAFAHEAHFPPESNDPSELPSGVASNWTTTAVLTGSVPGPGTRSQAMIKFFYGKSEITRTEFMLVVN